MNFAEKTLKSECVYDGKIMTILRDNVEISDGRETFREVVRHAGGVVILALKDDNKVLMVKQFRYPVSRTVLELPAGKLEKNEDPAFAAKRELEEETGYCAGEWKFLGYIYTSPGYSDEKLYLYFAQKLEFVGDHPDEGEIIKAFEMPLDEVVKKIKSGEINDAKTICAVMRAFYD